MNIEKEVCNKLPITIEGGCQNCPYKCLYPRKSNRLSQSKIWLQESINDMHRIKQ
jgi:hypothetical protein